MTTHKLLTVTDIDACFMDENYCYEDAMEAVNILQKKQFPLVLNSSKTLAELKQLTKELNLNSPLVAENGGIIAVPIHSDLAELCQKSTVREWQKQDTHWIANTGLSRDKIIHVAHTLRSEKHYQFEGFTDLGTQGIIKHTGLSLTKATMANERLVSEPILWNDTPEKWNDFYQEIQLQGMKALHGGRFIHLMGLCDKSDGLHETLRLYQEKEPNTQWTTLALGDSPNDLTMIEAADLGVIIPHADGPRISTHSPSITHADFPASKGWNRAVINTLKNF